MKCRSSTRHIHRCCRCVGVESLTYSPPLAVNPSESGVIAVALFVLTTSSRLLLQMLVDHHKPVPLFLPYRLVTSPLWVNGCWWVADVCLAACSEGTRTVVSPPRLLPCVVTSGSFHFLLIPSRRRAVVLH